MLLRRLLLLLIVAVLLAGCQKEESFASNEAVLQLQLTHEVDGAPLQLDAAYINPLGEDYTVSDFKYYLSNFSMVEGNSAVQVPPTYHLVNEALDSSKSIYIRIPKGSYTGMQLLVGVDSTRNVSGAQTGALDPALDMFWTWNTGYIMAKLEGSSSLSTAPNNRIQYHIGGFSGAYSSLRTLQISFPTAMTVTDTLQVDLTTELQRWFDGVHDLPIAQTAVSMTPGPLAAQYADNYASLFSLTQVLVK